MLMESIFLKNYVVKRKEEEAEEEEEEEEGNLCQSAKACVSDHPLTPLPWHDNEPRTESWRLRGLWSRAESFQPRPS